MRTIIRRTPAQKADLSACWARPDEEFFASGACHMLAAAFLLEHPGAGFAAWRLIPITSTRGGHLVVLRGDRVFDWAGYAPRDAFLSDYFAAMLGIFPDWDAHFEPAGADPISWEFCRAHHHRHPSQFLHDPLPRARAYVRRFALE